MIMSSYRLSGKLEKNMLNAPNTLCNNWHRPQI